MSVLRLEVSLAARMNRFRREWARETRAFRADAGRSFKIFPPSESSSRSREEEEEAHRASWSPDSEGIYIHSHVPAYADYTPSSANNGFPAPSRFLLLQTKKIIFGSNRSRYTFASPGKVTFRSTANIDNSPIARECVSCTSRWQLRLLPFTEVSEHSASSADVPRSSTGRLAKAEITRQREVRVRPNSSKVIKNEPRKHQEAVSCS